MNSLFSPSGTMARGSYLAHSLVAALATVAGIVAMNYALSLALPAYLGPLFFLVTMAFILIAAAASPLILPLLVAGYILLHSASLCLWQPGALDIPLALLSFAVAVAGILRLFALAVRRRRDAGKSALSAFALPGGLYVGAAALGMGLMEHGIFALLFFPLPIAVQCLMLFQPSRRSHPQA